MLKIIGTLTETRYQVLDLTLVITTLGDAE